MQLEIVYKELPENIYFIYTTICNKKYGIINININIDEDKQLILELCHFLYENNRENLIGHKDYILSDKCTNLFHEYLKQKAISRKEMFTSLKNKIQAFKDEQLA